MSTELANTLVTEWVKWQQHFVATMAEQPPKPDDKIIDPEQRPDFKENLDYETHSELSPKMKDEAASSHIGLRRSSSSTKKRHLSEQDEMRRNKDGPSAPEPAASPRRDQGARRSRIERERDNRSSMEGLSQINKMSETATNFQSDVFASS